MIKNVPNKKYIPPEVLKYSFYFLLFLLLIPLYLKFYTIHI